MWAGSSGAWPGGSSSAQVTPTTATATSSNVNGRGTGGRLVAAAGRHGRALSQRPLELLQHAHHPQAARAVRARRRAAAHALDEVAALEPQRLVVGHARAPDVARPRDVLAVVAVVLLEALVVDGQLALDRHVVEGRHPARADDREAPLLVRVEPGQVQVRSEPRREAQV